MTTETLKAQEAQKKLPKEKKTILSEQEVSFMLKLMDKFFPSEENTYFLSSTKKDPITVLRKVEKAYFSYLEQLEKTLERPFNDKFNNNYQQLDVSQKIAYLPKLYATQITELEEKLHILNSQKLSISEQISGRKSIQTQLREKEIDELTKKIKDVKTQKADLTEFLSEGNLYPDIKKNLLAYSERLKKKQEKNEFIKNSEKITLEEKKEDQKIDQAHLLPKQAQTEEPKKTEPKTEPFNTFIKRMLTKFPKLNDILNPKLSTLPSEKEQLFIDMMKEQLVVSCRQLHISPPPFTIKSVGKNQYQIYTTFREKEIPIIEINKGKVSIIIKDSKVKDSLESLEQAVKLTYERVAKKIAITAQNDNSSLKSAQNSFRTTISTTSHTGVKDKKEEPRSPTFRM